MGAGTVRNMEDFSLAMEAGAEFIVSPHLQIPLIEACALQEIPCIPGALTPTEIQTAYSAGATCIKVFPVRALGGPNYLRDLRGPFHDIPLLACGGVDPHNAADYRSAGADALAFGASIFRKEWLEAGDYGKISQAILQLRESFSRSLGVTEMG